MLLTVIPTPFPIHEFYLFCLITLVRTLSTVEWKWQSVNPCFILDLECIWLSTVEYHAPHGFLTSDLCFVVHFFCTEFLKGCWIFMWLFLCIWWGNHSYLLLNWCVTFIFHICWSILLLQEEILLYDWWFPVVCF